MISSRSSWHLAILLLRTNELKVRFSVSACDIANGTRALAQIVQESESGHGVSLLNDCRYLFDVRGPQNACGSQNARGTRLRMTLLRGFPDMSPEADAGEHELRYALYPHAGSWRDADTVRQGWSFNMPLIARQALRRAGAIAPWGAHGGEHPMPLAFGSLEVAPESIVLTAFKLEEDVWGPGSPLIVRLYETAGRETEATLTFAAPLMGIEETNHLEQRIESDAFDWDGEATVKVRFRPQKIKMFRLQTAVPGFAGGEAVADGGPGFGDG